jgi:hypothetical protein
VRALILSLLSATAGAATIDVPGGRLEVSFESRPPLPEAEVLDWVRNSARAVAAYFGRFPVARMPVHVRSAPGSGVVFGHADDDQVTLILGRACTRHDLDDDWIATHELTHLALPSLPRDQHWMEEGMATYVEPIARAQIGALSVEKVWGDLMDGLPNGLPAPGDEGLDVTHTWGRTYWGGALFYLLVDVEIRVRTRNQKGLQQALRGVLTAGNMQAEWSVERLIAVADAVVGVPVWRELYGQMKASPHPVDLPALWKRLGVARDGRRVVFDDGAPLAAIRKAITASAK